MPKIRFSLAWLLMLTALAASLSVHVANYWFRPMRPYSRFPVIDGVFAQARFVDLADADRLFLRFGGISDNGVELERVKDGTTVWLVYMDRLGVAHSEYYHDAFVRIDNWQTTRQIEINSDGSQGRVTEVRNVDTGALVSRNEHFNDERMRRIKQGLNPNEDGG